MVESVSTTASSKTESAVAQLIAADPWDAPYFGGPVYFTYADFPATLSAQTPAAVASPPSTAAATRVAASAAHVADRPRKQGRWARFVRWLKS